MEEEKKEERPPPPPKLFAPPKEEVPVVVSLATALKEMKSLRPTATRVRFLDGREIMEEKAHGEMIVREIPPRPPSPRPMSPPQPPLDGLKFVLGKYDRAVDLLCWNGNKWKEYSWMRRIFGKKKSIRTCKVFSLNVWFSLVKWKERTRALGRLLRDINADVVCLQEMTPRVLVVLLEIPFVRQMYYVAYDKADIDPYGVVILSKWPGQCYSVALPSKMGRRCLALHKGDFMVSTVHLESLNHPETRKRQLNTILTRIQCGNRFALCVGDMNVDHRHVEENAVVEGLLEEKGWVDVWKECKMETVPTHENGGRLDRAFLWKKDRCQMKIERIEGVLEGKIRVSDHYALLTELIGEQ